MTATAGDTRSATMLADVRRSLWDTPRALSPTYFYDERGSELFEEITRLPEYYLTRAEREILERYAADIIATIQPRTLVELGAGSAEKTRLLLDAMDMTSALGSAPGSTTGGGQPPTYMPVDVSDEFLDRTRQSLEGEYPRFRIAPLVADIAQPFQLTARVARPVLFAFLGSTIGNFDHEGAIALLARIRSQMTPADRLLLGTDLRKPAHVLHAAYNDAAGVTAAFNRNVLSALNAALGADFTLDAFAHEADYDPVAHRIEMRLRAAGDQIIHIPGLPTLRIADGEAIHTEWSHKYDRASVDRLAASAGLTVERWMTDRADQFGLSILAPRA